MQDTSATYSEKDFAVLIDVAVGTLRNLRARKQIGYIKLPKGVRYRLSHWDEYMAANEVKRCPESQKVHISNGTPSAAAGMSTSMKTEADASSARVRQMAERHKHSSAKSSQIVAMKPAPGRPNAAKF
jgi:hypothetical protein